MNYHRESLVTILVHHAQTSTSACSCKAMRLGESYPEHIADVYEGWEIMRERSLQQNEALIVSQEEKSCGCGFHGDHGGCNWS